MKRSKEIATFFLDIGGVLPTDGWNHNAHKRAATLGGPDTLVFARGIGENCTVIRSRVCEGLEFLGVELAGKRNTANETVISESASRVTRHSNEREIQEVRKNKTELDEYA